MPSQPDLPPGLHPDPVVQALADREAIRNLLARYGLLADSGDAEGLAALWTPDGEYDVGGYGVARGRAAIAGLITAPTHQQLMADGCAHVLSPHHIELAGDSAVASGYSTVFRWNGAAFEAWRVSTNQWFFARQDDGGWLATRRVNRPIGRHPH